MYSSFTFLNPSFLLDGMKRESVLHFCDILGLIIFSSQKYLINIYKIFIKHSLTYLKFSFLLGYQGQEESWIHKQYQPIQ